MVIQELLFYHDDVVPEQLLRDFSKTTGNLLGASAPPDVSRAAKVPTADDVNALLDILFATAHHPSLIASHRTAAVNALCGTLLQLLAAQDYVFRSLVQQLRVHERLMVIYLDRSEGAKQKSMEQLLNTLIKVLSKSVQNDSGQNSAKRNCISQFLRVLFEGHDRIRAKCSFHALTLFLSRGLVARSELVEIYTDKRPLDPGLDVTQDLILHVFEWVSFSDVAPSVGQFALLFLREENIANKSAFNAQRGGTPLWAAPLMTCLNARIDELRDFKNNVFPGVFSNDVEQYWAFLLSLNVTSYFDSGVSKQSQERATHTGTDLDHERLVLFAALEVGKECGLLRELDFGRGETRAMFMRDDIIFISPSSLSRLLAHSSPEARLSGLTLLTLSKQSTTPYSDETLTAMRRYLPHLVADTDANFRGEIVSLSQSLIYRLKSIISSSYRLALRSDAPLHQTPHLESCPQTSPATIVQRHSKFVQWYIDFLGAQLHPSASYQRHITALKILRTVAQSGLDERVADGRLARMAKKDVSWPYQLPVLTPIHARALTDLLLDAFDDVRQEALQLLKIVQVCQDQPFWPTATARADLAMKTSGRVDYADGVARLHDLVAYRSKISTPKHTELPSVGMQSGGRVGWNELDRVMSDAERAIEVAESDLSVAVEYCPVHGHFTASRYILVEVGSARPDSITEAWLEGIYDKAFDLSYRAWQSVKAILCNDAPEGFVPDDLEAEGVLTTKDTSSYAWRTLKESSLLLRTLLVPDLMKLALHDEKARCNQLRSIGDLSFNQLAELRHRGAFSTVSQTFAAVCLQCGSSTDDSTRTMPNTWFQKTISLINERGSATTRRSAGIPALVVGICTAIPKSDSFDELVTQLKSISEQTPVTPNTPATALHLPQVHAMNSLKALFTQPKLVERLESWIVPVITIAAQTLTSSIWPMRNSGLILFRGLIDRLLGSNEKLDGALSPSFGIVSRLSYERYPGLLDLLVSLLKQSPETQSLAKESPTEESIGVESIFPVLDLLRRAPPPPQHRGEIRKMVLNTLGSKHWHVRDLAARTYAASIEGSEVSNTVTSLLDETLFSRNELHGKLLCVKYLIASLSRSKLLEKIAYLVDVFTRLVSESSRILVVSTSELIMTAFMDSLNFIYQAMLSLDPSGIENSGLPQALAHDSIVSSRVLEGLPVKGSSFRIALELNTWLAHTTTQYLSALIPDYQPHANDHLRRTAFTESTDHETSSIVIEKVQDVFATAKGPVLKTIYANNLAQFAAANPELAVVCEAALTELLLSPSSRRGTTRQDLRPVIHYLQSLNIPARFGEPQSPSSFQQSLITWGLALGVISSTSNAVDHQANAWISVVQTSLHEDNDFDIRKAAVKSMLAFTSFTPSLPSTPAGTAQEFLLALYDALNDDDVDLRELAATAAARVYSRADSEDLTVLIPPIAAKKICTYLVKHHSGSTTLLPSAILRLTGQTNDSIVDLKPVHDISQGLLQQKTRLFEKEKQNLYRDDVREAELWSCVLVHLPVSKDSKVLYNALATWVSEGLDTLLQQTRREVDGPLGWTSKEGTFILGLRVLYATNVVLRWRQASSVIRVRGSDLRRKLAVLAEEGKKQDLHPMWLELIDETLDKSVTERVVRLGLVIEHVERGLLPL